MGCHLGHIPSRRQDIVVIKPGSVVPLCSSQKHPYVPNEWAYNDGCIMHFMEDSRGQTQFCTHAHTEFWKDEVDLHASVTETHRHTQLWLVVGSKCCSIMSPINLKANQWPACWHGEQIETCLSNWLDVQNHHRSVILMDRKHSCSLN